MYVPSNRVMSSSFDDEEVLLDLHKGVYYSLNRIGKEVWQLIAKGSSISTIIDNLKERYPVSRDIIKSDVETLVQDLLSEDLICPVE